MALGILIVFCSCTDEDQARDFKDIGTITGQDFRKCMCCGGWFIEINAEVYRFNELPDNSVVDLDSISEEFPIQVTLDWIKDQDACLGDEIIIERIKF